MKTRKSNNNMHSPLDANHLARNPKLSFSQIDHMAHRQRIMFNMYRCALHCAIIWHSIDITFGTRVRSRKFLCSNVSSLRRNSTKITYAQSNSTYTYSTHSTGVGFGFVSCTCIWFIGRLYLSGI